MTWRQRSSDAAIELAAIDPRAEDRRRWHVLVSLAMLAALSVFFVAMAAVDLANYRPISSDDVWIISVSTKLAREGVLGTDLYAGFANADRRFFLNLPALHFAQAAVFRLLGPGIQQARLVTLASGLVLVWVTALLAWRWFGMLAAVLVALLLVLWRSHLIGMDYGVPLLAAARTARYDLPAVALIWLTYLCFDVYLTRGGALAACATGVCAGLATLTQFFGVTAVAVVAAILVWDSLRPMPMQGDGGPRSIARRSLGWMLAGLAVVVTPYLVFCARYWQDAAAQLSNGIATRLGATPAFFLRNLLDEPRRYAGMVGRPGVGYWLLVIGVWPALGYLGYCLARKDGRGYRLLALDLAIGVALLALVDNTKAPLYALLLAPSLCMVLALALAAMAGGLRERQRSRLLLAGLARSETGLSRGRLWLAALAVALVAIVVLDGGRAYLRDQRGASRVSSYESLGSKLAALLPAGATAVGSPRWWWPLRDHHYLALNNLWLQWQVDYEAGRAPTFAAKMRENGADYLLLHDSTFDEIKLVPAELQTEFGSFLQRCAQEKASLTDGTYGRIDVYWIKEPC